MFSLYHLSKRKVFFISTIYLC